MLERTSQSLRDRHQIPGEHVRRVSLFIRQLSQDEKGQDLVEYALLAAFIAVAAGAFLPPVADSISVIFSKMKSTVNNAAQQ